MRRDVCARDDSAEITPASKHSPKEPDYGEFKIESLIFQWKSITAGDGGEIIKASRETETLVR